jgi:toxin ParE1/3/4
MTEPSWQVFVAQPAKDDFDSIVRWTLRELGADQAATHAVTLGEALVALRSGPRPLGVRRRDDTGAGLMTLHVARNKRRGRHFILVRIRRQQQRVVEVLRLLHDGMDMACQLPGEPTAG